MSAYYNENNPVAAHTLRHLIADGVIAPGDVDDRSIKEVQPDDLRGYTQCHFFAGFGGWSVAARLAGWADDRPLWTGSCPCQGESLAGKRLGAADPRHLWPHFFRIIRAARPPIVVGEQVAAAAGTHWLDGVSADLENENYAARAVDIPACAVDAPHIRQRLYWCAVDDLSGVGWREGRPEPEFRLGWGAVTCPDAQGALGHRIGTGLEGHDRHDSRAPGWQEQDRSTAAPDGRNGSYWSDYEWLPCHDGKARRAKSGIRLLVDGVPGRVDSWRLAGNGIVHPLAAEVLAALSDVLPEWRQA